MTCIFNQHVHLLLKKLGMETQIHIELPKSHCYVLRARIAKECYESPTHNQQMLILI